MKTLTICQPYAALIVTPQRLLPPGEEQKLVENRVWRTQHRGPLLIHAGMNQKWLGPSREAQLQTIAKWKEAGVPLVFGAALGVAWVNGCVSIETLRGGHGDHRALSGHTHAEGPYCFILANARPFVNPITMTGKQGYWNASEELLKRAKVCRLVSGLPDGDRGGSIEEWEQWCMEQGLGKREVGTA